jgi:hypothetical protein
MVFRSWFKKALPWEISCPHSGHFAPKNRSGTGSATPGMLVYCSGSSTARGLVVTLRHPIFVPVVVGFVFFAAIGQKSVWVYPWWNAQSQRTSSGLL